MKNKLTNNIGLKIGSLLAAIVIWLAVVNINDPNTSVTFYNVPVTIQNADAITSQGKIYEIEDNSDVVNRVTLYGPRSVLENVEKSNVVAVADMKNLSSVNTVSIDFSTTTNFNQITDIRASSENVKVTIETRKTVQMVLRTQVIGDAPEGYVVGSVTTDQNLVRVIGPESLINRISTAAITIDMNTMSGVTTDITTSATVRLYDDAGEEVTGSTLTKNPENVIATVNILPTKEVPLKFEVSGTPANGYAFSGTVTSDPEAVTVYGTKAAIAALSSITIPADELNITGQRENLVTRINIAEYVPDTVTLVSEDSAEVTVTVDIEPLETKEIKIDLHSIEIDDLPENMTCEFDTSNGDVITVTLVGIKKDLATLNATNILTVFKVNEWMATQGITKLPEGNYPVTLEFDLPEDVTLQSPVKVTMSAVNNPVDEENEGEGNEEQNNQGN